MKQAFVPASCHKGGHSIEGISFLLVGEHSTKGALFLVDILVPSLWDKRLGHLSNYDITHISKANYNPKLSFSDHQFMSIANTASGP